MPRKRFRRSPLRARPRLAATYIAAYKPTLGAARPYAGEMKLNFNTASSAERTGRVRASRPLYGRIINVSGGVSEGNINLDIRRSGGFTVRGTLSSDGEISGTATSRTDVPLPRQSEILALTRRGASDRVHAVERDLFHAARRLLDRQHRAAVDGARAAYERVQGQWIVSTYAIFLAGF